MVWEEVRGVRVDGLADGSWLDKENEVHPPTNTALPPAATHVVSSGQTGQVTSYWVTRNTFVRRERTAERGRKRKRVHRERCPYYRAANDSGDEVELSEGYERYCGCTSCKKVSTHQASALDDAESGCHDDSAFTARDVIRAAARAAAKTVINHGKL